MLRTLSLSVMALTLVLLPIVSDASCSARDDAEQDSDKTSVEAYKEVTIGETLATPEDHAGRRVVISGQFQRLYVHYAVADYLWTDCDWGIGDGSRILEVRLVSDSCLFWDRYPNYEDNEEIRLAGVVTVNLLGSGRIASVFLMVNVRDVDIETHPVALHATPESVVGKHVVGTGEIVWVDHGEGVCIIESAEGVKLGFGLREIRSECQVVGLHVRFAGVGWISDYLPNDWIRIRLYYLEDSETLGQALESHENWWPWLCCLVGTDMMSTIGWVEGYS